MPQRKATTAECQVESLVFVMGREASHVKENQCGSKEQHRPRLTVDIHTPAQAGSRERDRDNEHHGIDAVVRQHSEADERQQRDDEWHGDAVDCAREGKAGPDSVHLGQYFFRLHGVHLCLFSFLLLRTATAQAEESHFMTLDDEAGEGHVLGIDRTAFHLEYLPAASAMKVVVVMAMVGLVVCRLAGQLDRAQLVLLEKRLYRPVYRGHAQIRPGSLSLLERIFRAQRPFGILECLPYYSLLHCFSLLHWFSLLRCFRSDRNENEFPIS